MTHIEIKEDGRAWVIDGMPEEPKIRETNQFMYPDEKKRVNAENYAYESALAAAPRILCADQQQAEERIRQELGVRYSDMKPKPGIYSLPGVEWEEDYITVGRHIVDNYTGNYEIIQQKVAILKESPKEESQDAFLLHLVDVVACFATEQNMFYATKTRMELIQKARETFNSQKPWTSSFN